MKPLPIYDATAPIVCTITADETPDRIATVERLRMALQRIERTADGLHLTFPNETAIASDVERFTIDEKHCCQFWGFEATRGDGTITLRWDGPPDAADILDRLLGYFTGDEPLTIDGGLL